jgi:hypothetical protein
MNDEAEEKCPENAQDTAYGGANKPFQADLAHPGFSEHHHAANDHTDDGCRDRMKIKRA